MEELLLSEIIELCHGRIGKYEDRDIEEISTDSRDIEAGTLFVPLKGERFDGHAFIAEAADKGAAAALSDEGDICAGIPVIEVDDTLHAYQEIAAGYKQKFQVKTVGVTGSVGKTSTKEMIASVLSARYNTLKNEGNLNNEIGVPQSVLRLDKNHEAAVFEMGMNHFGEISRITRVVRPDIAVITNIGVAHMEYLGSREGIRKAKLEIMEGLSTDGAMILNGDDDLLWALRGSLSHKIIYYGIDNPECDLYAFDIKLTDKEIYFTVKTGEKHTHFRVAGYGKHTVYNALAAVAAGLASGMTGEDVKAGLQSYRADGLRQDIISFHGITVIDDTYNANPDSMRAALSVLQSLPVKGRKIAVLGGMLELGVLSWQMHVEVGKTAAQSADLLYVYGGDSDGFAEGARGAGLAPERIFTAATREILAAMLKKELKPGDAVLFKGSQGMKMKDVLHLWMDE